MKCDLCGGQPMCVSFCPPRPENSLPHLPLRRQSCLQYVPSYQVGRTRIALSLAMGKPSRMPTVRIDKRYQLAYRDPKGPGHPGKVSG